MLKKRIGTLIVVIILIVAVAQTGLLSWLDFLNFFDNPETENDYAVNTPNVGYGGVKFNTKVSGNYFYFFKSGKWEKKYINGVNIGATRPGLFPGELSISYDEYLRWFKQMGEMNVNCVRVYTTQRPQFYTALLDFNKQAKEPIYLFHGIWMNEKDIESLNDVYAQGDKILNEFILDGKNSVDVIHGNTTLPPRAGFASGNYTADVSRYVAGFIVGIEWDPKFVQNTNESNPSRNSYSGEYLYTFSSSPFEAFLCRAGDELISYETEKYKMQSTISFNNWVTTDPLIHSNEPHKDEDLVEVNIEHIRCRDKFSPGIFASYHVYPYYPEVFNYQPEYLNYKDSYGKKNPYRAYLHELKAAHTMPILVAEFGIPTSRALAHKSVMGYNQGNVDETQQGNMLLDLMNSIYEENYAGGFLFTWQDEWFKRTWNTKELDLADRRPFWSNIQTNEQNFGILAFDPGKDKCVSYVDGDVSEWKDSTPIIDNAGLKLYAKSDERYLYLYVKADNYNFETDRLVIPVDSKASQGNLAVKGSNIKFDKGADFLISIDGKNNSRITVDQYYDAFYYLYGEQYSMIAKNKTVRTKNSGVFNPMSICYGYEMEIPLSKKIIPFQSYETGLLKFGNANPDSPDYKSLSDFIYKDGNLEIKIPWQLLNVMDPSSKKIMDDFYNMHSITATNASDFYLGAGVVKGANGALIPLSGKYSWNKWEMPTYHERLKPSYHVLKEGFKKYNSAG